MATETLEFVIRPDGRVEAVVKGVKGEACLAVTEAIEQQLGHVTERQDTSERYEAKVEDSQTQQQWDSWSS